MKIKQHWIDDNGGLYLNEERSMKDLVTNKIIKSYTLVSYDEFKKLLTKKED